MLNQNLQ